MNRLDDILALTAAIEQHVLDADWTAAAEVDTRRRALLLALFDEQPGAAHDSAAREVLQQLMARNNQLMAQVGEQRHTTDQTLRQLNAAPTAMRAYDRNTPRATLLAAAGERP